jgi:hypothetical protein
MFSETRYALNGDLHVAYRASREGPRDIDVLTKYWQTSNCAHGGSAWADAEAATLPDAQPATSKTTNRALTQWIASAVIFWPWPISGS